ncbi:MAG TPA: LPS export ABC transporter periplasmic protein LptC, partial [Candidatus Xenobia bacterium]
EKKKQKVVLNSAGADVDMTTQDITFHGPVTAKANTGEALRIGHLRWDGRHHKFFGDADVRLTRGTAWMEGERMVADATLRSVELKGNVRIFLNDLSQLGTAKE